MYLFITVSSHSSSYSNMKNVICNFTNYFAWMKKKEHPGPTTSKRRAISPVEPRETVRPRNYKDGQWQKVLP